MHAILIILSLITKLTTSQICQVCQNLVKEFNIGLTASENGNFGGGNTEWEEKRLGAYSISETRLVHILESLCPSSSNKDKCQSMREESEEHIEKWWFNVYRKDSNPDSLYNYLCIDHLHACCPDNHFGPNCDRCHDPVCSGHGYCSGNGTRDGTGLCVCERGYSGQVCDTCLGGYQMVTGVCEDVNECSADSQLCRGPGHKCTNTAGSYTCDCHENYRRDNDGACVRKPQQSPPLSSSGTTHTKTAANQNDDNRRTHSDTSSDNNKKPKNKRQAKKIWTKKFEREFFKMLVCVVALGVVSYFLGRYSVVVVVAGILCGYYVYVKSIKLDQIFSRSFFV